MYMKVLDTLHTKTTLFIIMEILYLISYHFSASHHGDKIIILGYFVQGYFVQINVSERNF